MSYEDNNKAALVSIEHRDLTKAVQTLIGICTGITSDGIINDHEIYFLSTWLTQHPEVLTEWPGYLIADRVRRTMEDGIITDEERTDILETLNQITGNNFYETGASDPAGPIMPIDDDPSIYFKHMTYCFTGRFIYGTRASCERIVLSLGAMPVDRVTKKLNYLVIGSLIEPTWLHTSFGLKVQNAVKHRDNGSDICIISEKQWTKALKDIKENT